MTPTTFILHFYCDNPPAGARWRGTIEHIPSGQRRAFVRWDDLLDYLAEFSIHLESPCSDQTGMET